MSDLPKTLDLVGVAEIADMAGATKTSVSNWKKKWEDFPKPVADLRAGPVFWRHEVDAWLQKRLQKPNIKGYLRQSAKARKEQIDVETPIEYVPESGVSAQRATDILDRVLQDTPPTERQLPLGDDFVLPPPIPQHNVVAIPETAKKKDYAVTYPKDFKPGMIITEDDLK
jgi:predicted DNA-binding transcriptional regulator AlpA